MDRMAYPCHSVRVPDYEATKHSFPERETMKSITCDGHLMDLAKWIDETYTGVKDFNIVAMIATEESRNRWAIDVRGQHRWNRDLQKLLENLVAPSDVNDVVSCSALREAFVCLTRGVKYKERVDLYVASLSSRKGFSLVSTLGKPEGELVAV
jgi:hypothetical protein